MSEAPVEVDGTAYVPSRKADGTPSGDWIAFVDLDDIPPPYPEAPR